MPVSIKALNTQTEACSKGSKGLFLGSSPLLETDELMLKDLASSWLPGDGLEKGKLLIMVTNGG